MADYIHTHSKKKLYVLYEKGKLIIDPGFFLNIGPYKTWDPRPRLRTIGQQIKRNGDLQEVNNLLSDLLEGREETVFTKQFDLISQNPANLVGFGPGTSPAGDDWLSGYLCVADLMESNPGAALPALRQVVFGKLNQTSSAGRTVLLNALAGVPPDFLFQIIKIIALKNKKKVEKKLKQAIQLALNHGGSSGMDILKGFVSKLINP
jgi:hypothetical protein